MRGQGLKGGPNGDLYVYISVREHSIFKREGNDVLCEIPISLFRQRSVANWRFPHLKAGFP